MPGRRGRATRRFSVRLSRLSDDVLETILKCIRVPEARITIKGSTLHIEMTGFEGDIKESWLKLKNVVAELAAVTNSRGSRTMPMQYVAKAVKRTLPPELLAIVLSMLGWRSEARSDRLETEAEEGVVIDIAKRLASVLEAELVRFRVKGRSSKIFVAALAVLLDVSPEEAVRIALNEGVLEEEEDGTYRLKAEWRSTLSKLIMKMGVGLGEELRRVSLGQVRGRAGDRARDCA